MIPKGAEGISHIASRLVVDLLPKADDEYMAADLVMTADLIKLVAQDYDRAVDVLAMDHHDLCAILHEAAPQLNSSPLSRRIEEALASEPRSQRVSDLTERADNTMKVLIDLHQVLENDMGHEGTEWAARVNLKIWRFLEAYVARRMYQSNS